MYKFLSDKIIVVLHWAVASARHIFLSIIVVNFINLIFVHYSAYQQYYYIYQKGFGIQNMCFVYYRQFSLICLLDTQFLGYHQKHTQKLVVIITMWNLSIIFQLPPKANNINKLIVLIKNK